MANICFTLQFVLLLYFFGYEFTTILQLKTKENTYVGKSDFCHYFRPREVASLSLRPMRNEWTWQKSLFKLALLSQQKIQKSSKGQAEKSVPLKSIKIHLLNPFFIPSRGDFSQLAR